MLVSDNIPYPSAWVVDGISDHRMVMIRLPLNVNNTNLVYPVTVVKNFLNADDTSIIDHLEKCYYQFESMYDNNDVEDMWLFFKEIVFFCIGNYVPDRIKKTRCKNPRITRDIIHVRRRMNADGCKRNKMTRGNCASN